MDDAVSDTLTDMVNIRGGQDGPFGDDRSQYTSPMKSMGRASMVIGGG